MKASIFFFFLSRIVIHLDFSLRDKNFDLLLFLEGRGHSPRSMAASPLGVSRAACHCCHYGMCVVAVGSGQGTVISGLPRADFFMSAFIIKKAFKICGIGKNKSRCAVPAGAVSELVLVHSGSLGARDCEVLGAGLRF